MTDTGIVVDWASYAQIPPKKLVELALLDPECVFPLEIKLAICTAEIATRLGQDEWIALIKPELAELSEEPVIPWRFFVAEVLPIIIQTLNQRGKK